MNLILMIPQQKKVWRMLIMLLFFCVAGITAKAQSFSVTTLQHISFGAFTNSGGSGTVVISTSGTRTATGSIVPLNLGVQYKPAILEIDAPYGTIVSIQSNPSAVLNGSNGGTMSVQLDATDPVLPYATIVNPPTRTLLKLGGTLTVGSKLLSPPGNYTGSVEITFNYQ